MRRLRLLTTLLPALLAAGSAGCANDLLPHTVTGEYVFEVQYTNYAWAPTWRGISVDGNGDVWSFDASDVRTPAGEGDPIAGAALQAKYAHHRQHVGHVEAADLAARRALIAAAEHGTLQAPVGRCADAGTLTFRAFRYDIATDAYTPVLLHQQGDIAQKNTAIEAAQLTTWLRGLAPGLGVPDCEP